MKYFLVCLAAISAALPCRADPGIATHEPVVDKVSPAIVALSCKSPPRRGSPDDMGWFGTGTVISEDGAILTSTTVVPTDVRTDSILVSFAGGKQMKAEYVCGSSDLEIAMIRLPKGKYPFVPMGDSKALKLGHIVYTFGNCQNMMENDDQVSFAQGEVSGFYKMTDLFEGKNWYEWCSYKGDVIETTAPLNPGVDGGPLIDARGRLVGIMSLSYNETRWLGTAIPQQVLADRISKWQKGELEKDAPKEVVKPVKPVDPPVDPVEDDENTPYLGASFEADEPVVAKLAKGSPAAKAKLEVGDRFLSVDGKEMAHPAGILRTIKAHKPGETITIVVQRGGEKLTFKIKLGFQPM